MIGSARTRPTVTVIPPPAPASRRGCGRPSVVVTTSGRSGALGRPWAIGSPRQAQQRFERLSRCRAAAAKRTDRQARCPCSTGTRLVCALTANGAG